MKPGFLSSEWATLIITVLGTVLTTILASGIVPDGSLWAVVATGGLAVLGALGYAGLRTSLKKKELETSKPSKK